MIFRLRRYNQKHRLLKILYTKMNKGEFAPHKKRDFTENEIAEMGISKKIFRDIKSELYSNQEIEFLGNGNVMIQQPGITALKEKKYIRDRNNTLWKTFKEVIIFITFLIVLYNLYISIKTNSAVNKNSIPISDSTNTQKKINK